MWGFGVAVSSNWALCSAGSDDVGDSRRRGQSHNRYNVWSVPENNGPENEIRGKKMSRFHSISSSTSTEMEKVDAFPNATNGGLQSNSKDRSSKAHEKCDNAGILKIGRDNCPEGEQLRLLRDPTAARAV